MTEHEKWVVMNVASEHHFRCRCDKCAAWWVLMGPDGGVPDDFGPFSTEEIQAAAVRIGEPFMNGYPDEQ